MAMDPNDPGQFLNLPPHLRPVSGSGAGRAMFPGFGSPIQDVTAAPPAAPAPAPPAPAQTRGVPEARATFGEDQTANAPVGGGQQFGAMSPDELGGEIRNRAQVGTVGPAAGIGGAALGAPASGLFGLGTLALERFTREDFRAALQELFARDPAAAQQIVQSLSPDELAYLEQVMGAADGGGAAATLPTAAPAADPNRPNIAPGFATPPVPPPLPPERQLGAGAAPAPANAIPPANPPVPPPTPPRLPAGASGGTGDTPEAFGQERTGGAPVPPSLPSERQPEDFGQTRTGAAPVPDRRPSQEPSESQSNRGGGSGASPARGDVSNAGR